MNIVQKINKTFPLKKMYVPSGWLIAKNCLIDADLKTFNDLNDDDKFLIKENFFSSNIFYSSSECFAANNIYIKGVVDVGCLFLHKNNELDDFDIFSCDGVNYQVTLSIYKGKSRVNFYSFDKILDDRNEMINEVNFLMQFFSDTVIDVINRNGFKVNLDYHLDINRSILSSFSEDIF
ncbi:hypothetical protein ID858_18205 [Xenorhabdus sp. DI]|uniref:hypothetical protein n=1 Tax=Xenorhabdus doucetiae TaxID=351671 RepID=UPI00199B2FC3|nr:MULTISPECIES: hypothetical protein [unclassified Xenorhabdus]MBD2786548.1 hypothetical protein [Xenorhabdus sp. 3]MBD2790419.1 hypothetical protein [Xenorhabdus sp. DI]